MSLKGLSPELDAYLLSVGCRDDDVARRLRAETDELPNAGMRIDPLQASLLSVLIRATGARRVIEVGTFTGYSALSMARALPEDGRLVACDISEEYTSIARRYWAEAGVAHRIDLRLGPAVETLDALLAEGAEGSFDAAFIDADKENYEAYYERCLRMLRPGGLIMVDNVLWGGKVIDPTDDRSSTRAIRAFNEARSKDPRVDLVIVPIRDGLALLVKR